MIAIIGMVLLMGIVKKNAIMMIDFALEAERAEGKTPVEAIHQACLLRFRPIMMTTVCALVAGLPLALETGAASELRRPLGIAIVGGLLVSQWLRLYTTPVVYLCLDRLARWFGEHRSALPAEPGHPPSSTLGGFLDLAGHRHQKGVDDFGVARPLVMGDPSPANAPAPVPPCVRRREGAGSRISTHSHFNRGFFIGFTDA